MRNLRELEEKLAELGFGIQKRDKGTHVTANYYHLETREQLSYAVFAPEKLITWKRLFVFIEQNWDAIYEVSQKENIRGLYTR